MAANEHPELKIRAYVQNLYRFFKLFSRHKEFFDPFGLRFSLTNLSPDGCRRPVADNPALLRATAELLFKIEAWQDAKIAYEGLLEADGHSAELYQKLGFCSEQLGEYAAASEYYSMADLTDEASAWTLRHMAACLRQSGRPGEAVGPLRRLCRLEPESTTAALNLAFSLMESKNYEEAYRLLRELEQRITDTGRLWRALAWTAFMLGDYGGSREYWERISPDSLTAHDLLNMGHLAWAEARTADAISLYSRSMKMAGQTPAELRAAIAADFGVLADTGIDRAELPLLVDAIAIISEI